jgi:hypothetical protein
MAGGIRIVFVDEPTFEQTYGLQTLDELNPLLPDQLKAEYKLVKQKITEISENRKRVGDIARRALILLRRRGTFITALIRMKKGGRYQ